MSGRPELLAFSQEHAAVVDGPVINVYQTKTLKKLRVVRPSDDPIVCLFANAKKKVVSVDVSGRISTMGPSDGWRLESTVGCKLPSSRTERHPTIISAQPCYLPDAPAAGEGEKGDLRVIAMTQTACLCINPETGAHEKLFDRADVPDSLLAVGQDSAMVVTAQHGEKWIQYKSFNQEPVTIYSPVPISTIAVHPTEQCIAVGGTRGELVIMRDLAAGRHFMDHWHHAAIKTLYFTRDGAMLISGGIESILLLWNMQNYTYEKLSCSTGAINCVVGDPVSGADLLVTCAEATMATVSLLRRKVTGVVQGVQWSSSHPCRGVHKTTWRGQTALILTGLPDSVRLYDPIHQQTVHTIHVSHNMEATVDPPERGVHHVVTLKGGTVVVTYESSASPAVPPLLRWWVYDDSLKRHVERQSVAAPHPSEVVGMVADPASGAVITLSAGMAKYWAPRRAVGNVAADDEDELEDDEGELTVAASFTKYRPLSSWAVPTSAAAASLALSKDGQLLFVATDSVYCLHLGEAQNVGNQWPLLFTFTQSETQVSFDNVMLLEERNTVAAMNGEHFFVWSCVDGDLVFSRAAAVKKKEQYTAATPLPESGDVLLIAGPKEDPSADSTVMRVTTSTNAKATPPTPLEAKIPVGDVCALTSISSSAQSSSTSVNLAVISRRVGMKLLTVDFSKKASAAEELAFAPNGAGATANNGESEKPRPSLAHFFPARQIVASQDEGYQGSTGVTKLEELAGQRAASSFLTAVVGGEAFAAPPVATLLSTYLSALDLSTASK